MLVAVKPYGTWPSPVSAGVVADQGLRLGSVALDGDDIYWLEGRPAEGGRNVLIRRSPDGRVAELTPPGFNVRTRVHEYGGGAYVVANGTVYFSNFADQRIYRIGGSTEQDPPYEPKGSTKQDPPYEAKQEPSYEAPVPITPEGDWFYADATFDSSRRRLICVREDHTGRDREAVTTLVSIPVDGEPHAGDVVVAGHDFYSTPRLSPDGSLLAWISWRHPNMPWDGTELWVADVTATGALRDARLIAGSASESIYQPGWSPDGVLHFVSDREGWWRIYRCAGAEVRGCAGANIVPVLAVPPAEAEFGRPQWIFGSATWAFSGDTRMVVSYSTKGRWYLGIVDIGAGTLTQVGSGLEPGEWLAATSTHAVLVVASATTSDAVVKIDLESGSVETLRAASALEIDPGYISVPEAIEFPTAGNLTAHAFYYPPRNKDCGAAWDERPPLVVIGHGGPISAAHSALDLKVQFWTSRGFAVVDVNYGGSSGFGTAYRRRLNGQWGIVDVADTINAATYLVSRGQADANRLIVRGGSAGGYTTLAALTFYPELFKAGASYYGISDLEVLIQDSHKFEARCLDILVGPYPAMKEVYRARSPIYFVDRLSCPLILFQGLEDKVVPPNQSKMMADAVRAKRRPVAYLTFEGEQHGFRKAETIVRSHEAELYFYGAVFGFTPADRIEPIAIDNLN